MILLSFDTSNNIWWLLLDCLAALICGMLTSYFISYHHIRKELRTTSTQRQQQQQQHQQQQQQQQQHQQQQHQQQQQFELLSLKAESKYQPLNGNTLSPFEQPPIQPIVLSSMKINKSNILQWNALREEASRRGMDIESEEEDDDEVNNLLTINEAKVIFQRTKYENS